MPAEAFNYLESSLPAGQTIGEYRRARVEARPRRTHRMPRLLSRMT
jgi:hypothetical protein